MCVLVKGLRVTDFEEVLKLEPGNKQALNELQKLQAVRWRVPQNVVADRGEWGKVTSIEDSSGEHWEFIHVE